MPWYNRINALFIKAVLGDANKDNLLLIPIYRPNTLEHLWFKITHVFGIFIYEILLKKRVIWVIKVT